MNTLLRSDGFTIVELLAAMVVSSFVVAFVYSMYLFSVNLLRNWDRTSQLRSSVNECALRIADDLMTCSQVDECDDSLLVLQKDQIDTITYRFTNEDVARNGLSFSAIGTDATSLMLTRIYADVSFIEDTTVAIGWPARLWSIRVVGKTGNVLDSSVVRLSTMMSSQEIADGSLVGANLVEVSDLSQGFNSGNR